MAFNTNTGRAEYTASAGQTLFSFVFKIFNNTDIKVYKTLANVTPHETNDLLILGTDYTVAIDGDAGGSITLLSAASINDAITLLRDLPTTREIEYQTSGDLLAETLNDDQEYQTYLLADNKEVSNRTLVFEKNLQGMDNVLPTPEALRILRWNSTGKALENTVVADDGVFVNIFNINTIEELLIVNPDIYSTINVKGYHSANDGGGDLFNYGYSIDKSTANGGTIIDPDQTLVNQGNGVGNGCWIRQFDGETKAAYFGVITALTQIDVDRLPEKVLFDSLNLTISENITFSKAIIMNNCALVVNNVVYIHSNSILSNSEVDMNNSGQLVIQGKNNISIDNCSFLNSAGSGLLIRDDCSNISIKTSKFTNNATNGLEIFCSGDMTIFDCASFGNAYHGFFTYSDSVGTTPYDVLFNKCTSHNNGTGTSYSGITFKHTRDCKATACISYDNAEHGFVIEGGISNKIDLCDGNNNAFSGLMIQEETIPSSNEAINISVINSKFKSNGSGATTKGNGITLLDNCKNTHISNCELYDNITGKAIRTLNSGGGTGPATIIAILNCKLYNPDTSVLNVIENGNTSLYWRIRNNIDSIAQHHKNNIDNIVSSSVLNINGNESNDTDIVLVSGTATTTAVSLGSTIERRKLTIIATDPAGFTVGHDATTSSYAPFILTGSVNATLTQYSSLTFYCDGDRWIEIARSIK